MDSLFWVAEKDTVVLCFSLKGRSLRVRGKKGSLKAKSYRAKVILVFMSLRIVVEL